MIVTDSPYFKPGDTIQLDWTPTSFISSSATGINANDLLVDIILYRVEDNGEIVLTELSTLATDVENTGTHTATLPQMSGDNIEDTVSIFVRAKLSSASPNPSQQRRKRFLTGAGRSDIGKRTDIIMIDNNVNGANWEKCEEWTKNEPESIGQELEDRVSNVACPTTESGADLPNSGLKLDNQFISRYHPDAENCYTQRATSE